MASSPAAPRRTITRAPGNRRIKAAGAAIAVLALVGGGYAAGRLAAPVDPAAEQAALQLASELDDQRQLLQKARATVDQQVAALATRVGRMQAQLMRVDALGKHLTEVAKLDRGEFNFDEAPGLGGPQAEAAGAGPEVPVLDNMLDSVGAAIDDRQRQLTALQNLILSRELARQIVPGGRPVESGYISSQFGQRTDPFNGNGAFHSGLDFVGPPGTRVLAVADGIVSHAGMDGGYGRLVEITHGNGYVTRYAHNSRLLVEPGQTIRRGEPVAVIGSSGRSTGTHLHFEVLREGRHVNPLSFVRR